MMALLFLDKGFMQQKRRIHVFEFSAGKVLIAGTTTLRPCHICHSVDPGGANYLSAQPTPPAYY